jgi:hypothetical protein
VLKQKGTLFTPRTAKCFVPKSNLGNTGADFYIAKNPAFGAVFTYHLSDDFKTQKQQRQESEKERSKNGRDIPFPGYDRLDAENQETPAKVWLTIKDNDGNVIRNLYQKAEKGTHRLAWNLRHASIQAVNPDRVSDRNPSGPMVTPGNYSAQLYLQQNGQIIPLGASVNFEVKPIRESVLKGVDYATFDAYRKDYNAVSREVTVLRDQFAQAQKKAAALEMAARRAESSPELFVEDLNKIDQALFALERKTTGSAAREEVGEKNPPNIQTHLSVAYRGLRTTYGPTGLHRQSLSIAQQMIALYRPELEVITKQMLPQLEKKLKQSGAPYIKGND